MGAYDIANSLVIWMDEGVTVDREGVPSPHEAGYYVGGVCPSLVFDSVHDVDRGELAWWIGNKGPSAKFFGAWIDEEDGKVYFDVTQHFQTLQAALWVGQLRNEIAVWDIANGEEIRVNPVQ